MSQILSIIGNLDGAITKEIRPKLEKDVNWYLLLASCCGVIDDFYSEINIALDDIQAKHTGYGSRAYFGKIALLLSEKKVLDNLVKCLNFYQAQTDQSLNMIKSEITTGAIHDERCVYSFLCIADGFKNSLINWSKLIVIVNKHFEEKLKPILSELKEWKHL